jgi:hypothetical protein
LTCVSPAWAWQEFVAWSKDTFSHGKTDAEEAVKEISVSDCRYIDFFAEIFG